MWLRCKNQGEIELNAFKLLGACTKRNDDSKIGFFGTGLKYAISVLLREKIPLKIYSGLNEIVLGTESDSLRGIPFDVITINGEKTSLTTDTGIKWKVWQAIREIVCNAIDEDGVTAQVKSLDPVAGETHIYVEIIDAVADVCKNWDKFFAFDRDSIYEDDGRKIFEKTGTEVNIYRRGIRCFNETDTSLFDYDFKNVDISEDRLASYSWVLYEVAKIMSNPPVDVIKRYIETYKTPILYFEKSINYDFLYPGNNWVEALKGKQVLAKEFAGWYPEEATKSTSVQLPMRLVNRLFEKYPSEIEFVTRECNVYEQYVVVHENPRHRETLDRCLNLLRVSGLYHEEQIKIAAFQKQKDNVLVKPDYLVVPVTLFNKGAKMVAAHLSVALVEMNQDSSIMSDYLTLLEEKHNIYL